jgi:hypothetical protein
VGIWWEFGGNLKKENGKRNGKETAGVGGVGFF